MLNNTEELVQKLDFQDFEQKLGLWADKFKPFIESKEMYDLYQKIKEDAIEERIVPAASNTFRAFSTMNPVDLKVIFFLQDPYPRFYRGGIPQATGIAMDCSNSPRGDIQPSLKKWYEAIETDLGQKVVKSPNLLYLHEQGVMMLNTDLTCKVNKTGSHEGLWKPFQKYFLEEVLRSHPGIIYVLCGKSSHLLRSFIAPFSHVFELEHPSHANRHNREWEHKGIFNVIDRILIENKGFPIYWDKKEWEAYKEPPF